VTLPLGNTLQVATLRQKFGRHLREIRAQRQMTQEQFAETLDMSVDFLSLIERGKNAPSFETLDKIAKRLKMSVSALFTFESPRM
jgi:transcriptional regulator with XRE-family HTH domain